mgnify:FL=1
MSAHRGASFALLLLICIPLISTPDLRAQVRVHFPDRLYSTLASGTSLWVGTPRGLYRYRFEDNVWSAYGPQNGLPSAEITTLDRRSDVIWIGQQDALTTFDLRSNTMLHFDSSSGLPVGRVRTIAFEDDYVWTGGSSGAARYDELIEEWQRIGPEQGLRGSAVHAVVPEDDRVFLATEAGVEEYDPRYERWRYYDAPAAAGIRDAFAAGPWLWLLGETALYRFDTDARVFSPYALKGFRGSDIREIIISGSGFWMLTANDLWQYDASADALRPFLELTQLPDNDLRAVTLSADSRTLWFSTASGLTRYDRATGGWTYFTTASGLPEVAIHALFALGDGVVAFSDTSLVYYRSDQDRWYTFPLLQPERAAGTRFSLDPADGSFADFGDGIRLDLSGSRSSWLIEDPFGNEDGGDIARRNDLKARLDLGDGRGISAMYNDADFEDVTYGAEYRGARADILQSLQWGDIRIEEGRQLLEQSYGVFGVGGRAEYGPRTERYGRSFLEVAGLSGHKTTALATDAYYGRTRSTEFTIPDGAWQRFRWYHLREDRRLLPLDASRVAMFRSARPDEQSSPLLLRDAVLAGIRDDWIPLVEGVDYFVDHQRSILQLAEPAQYAQLVARIGAADATVDLLLQSSDARPLLIRNRYFVGGYDIIPSSFTLRITDAAGADIPLSRFDLDRDSNGSVDADFIDYHTGILHFPQEQPFPDEAYADDPITTYTMHIRFEAFSTGYQLSRNRIIRGTERVLVDGLEMRAGEDYILDYSSGFLLFTRDGAVQDDSRIEVQYEYVRSVSEERVTRVGVTVSPSDFAHAGISAGRFHPTGDADVVTFTRARAEVRWQSEALDVRVQPEYTTTWSDTSRGQAAGITATVSTPEARLSLRSTMSDRNFLTPQERSFSHGRLLDEHRIHGEYDLVPELRAFATWTKRDGFDTLTGIATDDMYAYGGLQYVTSGLPSITLRGERSRESLANSERSRSGGRIDMTWVPDTKLLESASFSSARITGYARMAEERIDGGVNPGDYRVQNYFLRTVLAPRPLFTINAYYQADTRERRGGAGTAWTDDRSEDRLYVDVIMEELRGISLSGRLTQRLQQFDVSGGNDNQHRRGSLQASLRLAPGIWVAPLSPLTLYVTASENRSAYRSAVTSADRLIAGLLESGSGRTESESISRLFESRIEWRPMPEVLYSVTGRLTEHNSSTWDSNYRRLQREMIQRADYRPDSRSLYALQLTMLTSNDLRQLRRLQEYAPSAWAERRLSRELLFRLTLNARYSDLQWYTGNSTTREITPGINMTATLHDLPVLRRLELREDLTFTYREHAFSFQETVYARDLRNTLSVDWYPHAVLSIRLRYSVRWFESSSSLFTGTEPDAQLQVIMQL